MNATNRATSRSAIKHTFSTVAKSVESPVPQRQRGQPLALSPWSISGEGGIRTPGTLRYAGFQDQCIRPLCHLSGVVLQTGVPGTSIWTGL